MMLGVSEKLMEERVLQASPFKNLTHTPPNITR